MGVADACRASEDGVRLEVEVVPNAADPGFPTGYNPWRKRIQARLTAAPSGGEANRELVDRVSAAFGVDASSVGIVAGHTSRRKSVVVRGVELDTAVRVLGEEVVD